ncbi:immunoglobulin superfamily member 22-like [Mizuhopecten yessoensis]|uniref:immunoglobulin superfamily member 22-like n=1 Tax=Mizuhopecten yessoensis TaxID=6573 RepID=UPI000B458E4B|nr:immunoglobulin superfamily member 22-like [Mizuhopecten yessoensis]
MDDRGVPSKPCAVQVTNADRTSLAISWNPPIKDGGSPVTGYIVEKQTAWTQVAKVPADELSCVADNLIEGTEYGFRITAVNKFGKGKALESDQTCMVKSPNKSPQPRDTPETTERDTSDIKEPLQTTVSRETERDISDMKDCIAFARK